jgi:hypothetical protein
MFGAHAILYAFKLLLRFFPQKSRIEFEMFFSLEKEFSFFFNK